MIYNVLLGKISMLVCKSHQCLGPGPGNFIILVIVLPAVGVFLFQDGDVVPEAQVEARLGVSLGLKLQILGSFGIWMNYDEFESFHKVNYLRHGPLFKYLQRSLLADDGNPKINQPRPGSTQKTSQESVFFVYFNMF